MGYRISVLLVLLLTGTTAFAGPDINLELLKKNTRIFERIVSEIISQNFPNPFAVTGEAEGSYLEGYG
ncbi:MAG: hypothetical protein O6826_11675, partial [Acidobacteria bacterium]|nr:hypothetical protein [Acidobacteriota bacterium]